MMLTQGVFPFSAALMDAGYRWILAQDEHDRESVSLRLIDGGGHHVGLVTIDGTVHWAVQRPRDHVTLWGPKFAAGERLTVPQAMKAAEDAAADLLLTKE
jgi:hypothetical protein